VHNLCVRLGLGVLLGLGLWVESYMSTSTMPQELTWMLFAMHP
jgi:hypothetical protein